MSGRLTQLALAAALAALTPMAHAQHGGGPGGGGPGGGMGHGGWGGGGGFAGHYGGDGSYGPPMRSGPQLGPPGRWWDDHKMVKTLKLRPDQQRRMDDIFEASKPQLVGAYETFQREELRLAAMPAADLQDESKVFAGIDRVEQARATLEKESAHIILQIRHELDADQLARLDKELAENH